MKPREYFETAVRIIGLVLALYGTSYIVEFSAINIGYFRVEHTDVTYYLLMGIGHIIVGLYFMRGASHFVRYAYGEEEKDPGDAEAGPPGPDEMEMEKEEEARGEV